jgi:hypothetical protein
MAVTNKLDLTLKNQVNAKINNLFSLFYKEQYEINNDNIYNYLKIQKIGSGHDELLKKQKKQILHYKLKIKESIITKITNMGINIDQYELEKNNHINTLSLLQYKPDQIEIKIRIEIENIDYSNIINIFYLIYILHLNNFTLSDNDNDDDSSKKIKEFKKIGINLKELNDTYISEETLKIFIHNQTVIDELKKIQKISDLSQYDSIRKILLTYIKDKNTDILIYKNIPENLYYKIEISTKDDKYECKMYLLNKDDTNIKKYLEKISNGKKIEIHHM